MPAAVTENAAQPIPPTRVMDLRVFEFADYSAFTDDKKLIINGVFSSVTVRRDPNAPAGAPEVVQLPPCWLVWVIDASLMDGLQHTVGLAVRTEDGEMIIEHENIGTMAFSLNPTGRPMRFHGRLRLDDFKLPRPSDYEFQLLVDGKQVGKSAHLYMDIAESITP